MKKIILILILTFIFTGCTQADKVETNENINLNTNEAGSLPDVYETPVAQLGLMIHLEGWKNEVDNEDAFRAHAQGVRDFAEILNEYQAKGTFEASPEFIRACQKYDDNVILELAQQGHGIGVHADVGGNPREGLTFEQFVSEIELMKQDLEKLTNQEVLHVSGICSDLDWVKAAANADYKFTTGIVGYCAMSLPQSKRPQEYFNCPNPGACHGPLPTELADRLHPWRASTATNWLVDNPEGSLVILSGDYVLKDYVEDDQFNQQDIDSFINQLEEAISLAQSGQVNLLYPALSIGSIDFNTSMYQKWLDAIQPYLDSGKVEWKTLPETYQDYIN